MSQTVKKCMVCAKPAENLRGGICEVCQDKIRREAMGQQARNSESAERELSRHGVTSDKK
jgi:predicted amidophosphoribosyltransferase